MLEVTLSLGACIAKPGESVGSRLGRAD